MTLKRSKGPAGTLIVLEPRIEDPKGQSLCTILTRASSPCGCRRNTAKEKQRFPVLGDDLVGFTGSGLSHTNWKPFGDNVPERAARLMREGRMGPAIFVFPDCFTRSAATSTSTPRRSATTPTTRARDRARSSTGISGPSPRASTAAASGNRRAATARSCTP